MKKISWKKYLKIGLRISSLLTIVIVLFCGWATQRQETINQQLFLDSRVWNGIGVLFLLIGWGFWEWFLTSKTGKNWKFITSFTLMFITVIVINGVLGLIFGSIMLASLLSVFLLNYYKTIPLGKVQ